MAEIRLPGEQRGTWSIAGLFFTDGVTEAETLTVKQAYLLGVLMGADIPEDVTVKAPTPAADVLPPAPAVAEPPRSTADDLAAMASGASVSDIAAEPAPKADPVPSDASPTVAPPEPQEAQDDAGSTPTSDDTTSDPTEPEAVPEDVPADDPAVSIPDAPAPVDAPADETPEPISTSDDGSTITEPAVEPDPITVTPADITEDAPADPVAAAAETDTPVDASTDGGVAPAGADVTGSTDTSATTGDAGAAS